MKIDNIRHRLCIGETSVMSLTPWDSSMNSVRANDSVSLLFNQKTYCLRVQTVCKAIIVVVSFCRP